MKRVILDIECVRGNSLYHYTPPNVTQQFLKIYVATPRIITNGMTTTSLNAHKW